MESARTVEELVSLVDSLYSERDPSKIGSIQSYLQQIQKSPDGLPFAELLLSTPGYSLNCKFFGALTYTVNLTQQSKSIDIDSVLIKLLEHLTVTIHDYRYNKVSNLFIIRKLCNNLSKIFNSYTVNHKQWADPLNPFVQILLTDQIPDLSKNVDYQQVLPSLISDEVCLSLLLIFATTIIEDLTKLAGDNVEVNEVVQSNIYPIIKFIFTAVFQSSNDQFKLVCLPHLNAWISYVSFVECSTIIRYRDLNEILQYLMGFFVSQTDDLYHASVESLTQIYELNPHILSLELRTKFNNLLLDPLIQLKVSEFFESEDISSLESFVVLVLASLDFDIIHVATTLFRNDDRLLPLLLNLTNVPLLPVLEENISSKFIEFWSQLSDLFVDELDSIEIRLKQDKVLIDEVKSNSTNAFYQLSTFYFKKIQLSITSNHEFKQYQNEFLSYRQDVADLFESIYSNLGLPLYEVLIENVRKDNDINNIEASLFLLKAITENISGNNDLLPLIDSLFDSDFLGKFDSLSSQLGDRESYYLKSSITFLGSLDFFYKINGSHHLSSVIGYLFNALKSHPSLHPITCRTIVEICDECRLLLYGSLSNFEPILIEMINNYSIDSYMREKIINSIGCIIQSVPDPQTQVTHVYAVTKLIEQASSPLLTKIDSLDEEQFKYLSSLFSCLKELGESLSAPDDFEDNHPEQFNNYKVFYQSENDITNYILSLINVFGNDLRFIQTSVDIFKVGLLENFGPFSFSTDSVVQFAFSKISQNSPILSHQLELLTTVVNVGLRRTSPPHQKITDEVLVLIVKRFIMDQITFINQDPDLIQLSINLFTTIVINKPSFLLNYGEVFNFIISKTLELLRTSEERFVKKSLLKFWTNLIGVRKVSAEEAAAFQKLFEQEIGSILTYSVFNGLISTVRSDVESYSNIIVVLLSKYQLHFKTWIKLTLDRIDQERAERGLSPLPEKDFFIKQLLVTRGSTRKCNVLIKEYWAKANGLMSYQSIYSK